MVRNFVEPRNFSFPFHSGEGGFVKEGLAGRCGGGAGQVRIGTQGVAGVDLDNLIEIVDAFVKAVFGEFAVK